MSSYGLDSWRRQAGSEESAPEGEHKADEGERKSGRERDRERAPRLTQKNSSDSIAICITGLVRTLFSYPVLVTYSDHVIKPLRKLEYEFQVFMSIVDQQGIPNLHDLLVRHYQPTRLSILRNVSFREYCGRVDKSLVQFYAIRDCYRLVEATENLSGKFDWIFRLRTDLVYFSDIAPSLLNLTSDRVYVPSGGMSPHDWAICQNDHMFFCPRTLCRPYFYVLELFESPYCEDGRGHPVAVPDGLGGPPNKTYELKKLPRLMAGQFYFMKRYGRNRLIFEKDLHYAIARSSKEKGKAGVVECRSRLEFSWRPALHRSRRAPSRFVKDQCKNLQRAWGDHV